MPTRSGPGSGDARTLRWRPFGEPASHVTVRPGVFTSLRRGSQNRVVGRKFMILTVYPLNEGRFIGKDSRAADDPGAPCPELTTPSDRVGCNSCPVFDGTVVESPVHSYNRPYESATPTSSGSFLVWGVRTCPRITTSRVRCRSGSSPATAPIGRPADDRPTPFPNAAANRHVLRRPQPIRR